MQKDLTKQRQVVTIDSDQQSYEVVVGNSATGLVFLCDHATNRVPDSYSGLGLAPADFERHIAYDVGAEAVTRQVAARLGVPAVFSRFSRLLIDPNRGPDDPTLIMRFSDGTIIPANRHVDDQERMRRIETYYRPYHDAIDRVLDGVIKDGVTPIVISIHSFTEAWKGRPRPWHAAVLWDEDDRVAGPLISGLRAEGDLMVGDNVPYSGRLRGDTMWRHGTKRALPHALIEIRQDLIRDQAGQQDWVRRLARVFDAVVGEFRASHENKCGG